MLFGEKLLKLIKENHGSVPAFHSVLKERYKKYAITKKTLYQIISGRTKEVKETTLSQLAGLIGVEIKELKKDTNLELPYSRYTYNEDAHIIVFAEKLAFMPGRLTIKAYGKTCIEQDPGNENKYEKWVYCLAGELTVHVLMDKIKKQYFEKTLKKGEEFGFSSSFEHYFENKIKKTAVAIVIQNPKYY